MNDVLRYEDFNKLGILFSKEHDKFLKKYSIDFIFLSGVKLPFIYLYEIVEELFKNNSIILQKSEIILLTITAIASMSKEDKGDIRDLNEDLEKRKILKYLKYVKYTIKSLKNIFNIILKDETIILNFEQAIKHKSSIKILYSILSHVSKNKIGIKSFFDWFVVGNRNSSANELLNSIKIDYRLIPE